MGFAPGVGMRFPVGAVGVPGHGHRCGACVLGAAPASQRVRWRCRRYLLGRFRPAGGVRGCWGAPRCAQAPAYLAHVGGHLAHELLDHVYLVFERAHPLFPRGGCVTFYSPAASSPLGMGSSVIRIKRCKMVTAGVEGWGRRSAARLRVGGPPWVLRILLQRENGLLGRVVRR